MGFSIFSIEIVSILCHFMPFYAIENLKNLEFRKKLFLSPKLCIGLRKTEKIFSINNEQGIMKRGEKWFPEKFEIF